MAHGSPARIWNSFPFGQSVKPGMFGRLFPNLKPLRADDAALTALGVAMIETAPAPDAHTPAGYTYLGQFIDHDLTLDTTSISEQNEDPLATENFRTPRLDLDGLYGQGPDATPQLYQRGDTDKFLIGLTRETPNEAGATIPSLPNDLPRNVEGRAIIGDPRNDENLLVAQLHLAFLKFHNKVVDTLRGDGLTGSDVFREARHLVTWHYQWIVLHDFLPRLIDTAVLKNVLTTGRKIYCPEEWPFIPVEFSAAAYRLGHSMVRPEYDHNRVFNPSPKRIAAATFPLLFRFTGLSGPPGSVPLPSNWIIDWQRFFPLPPSSSTAPNKPTLNHIRRIDPFLAAPLHHLPGFPTEGALDSLAVRNLLRGRNLGLPSGQAVAAQMGAAPLTAAELSSGPDGAVAKTLGFEVETPLWYYILKEAQIKNAGERLGKVGSRILAEVFVGLLESDSQSFRAQAPEWTPTLPAALPNSFTMSDLLQFVGDTNPLGEP